MKNLFLILAIIASFHSCKKTNKSSTTTVYCMYTEDGGTHIYRGCAEGKEAMQNKTVELRNQGYTVITNTEKSNCSDCK